MMKLFSVGAVLTGVLIAGCASISQTHVASAPIASGASELLPATAGEYAVNPTIAYGQGVSLIDMTPQEVSALADQLHLMFVKGNEISNAYQALGLPTSRDAESLEKALVAGDELRIYHSRRDNARLRFEDGTLVDYFVLCYNPKEQKAYVEAVPKAE